MSEIKKCKEWIIKTGQYIRRKRLSLGPEFKNREFFIEDRSKNLFDYEDWISSRYFASIELGKNQMSIEKLIQIAYALEMDPVEMFGEILQIYQQSEN